MPMPGALSDREERQAAVLAEHRSVGVDDRAGGEAAGEAAAAARERMSTSTKQRSCDSGLAAVTSPSAAASARTPALRFVAAEHEDGAAELVLVEAMEHVRLVAAPVYRPVQRRKAPAAPGPRVVARGEMRRTRRPARVRAATPNLIRWLQRTQGFGVIPDA